MRKPQATHRVVSHDQRCSTYTVSSSTGCNTGDGVIFREMAAHWPERRIPIQADTAKIGAEQKNSPTSWWRLIATPAAHASAHNGKQYQFGPARK